MQFDRKAYRTEEVTVGEESIRFHSYRDLVYVDASVNEAYQRLNLYVPEQLAEGGTINGWTVKSAPIFMPNTVGGYMPGLQAEPGSDPWRDGAPNTVFKALKHGYVVAAPAIRGRDQKNEEGLYTGKAPACIVDYKAAVRFLRQFAGEIPGDTEKIITNGTSAGGALSSLMGATGNHPDYEPWLQKAGAANQRDDIFAASCYCPITNLEHADAAYEWEFFGLWDYHRQRLAWDERGQLRLEDNSGVMDERQIQTAAAERVLFPAYLNSLDLTDEDGCPLLLDELGDGTFKEYVESIVLASAQRALDQGEDLSKKGWLTVRGRKAVSMDFDAYVRDITRMKPAPAFDGLSLETAENNLFGDEKTDSRHFTVFSHSQSLKAGQMADQNVIKLMNPMDYIADEKAKKAPHWRIRHGECDRDTSLAISAMLAVKLKNQGLEVDYHSPWNVSHSGDYDLEELFAWIDGLCRD